MKKTTISSTEYLLNERYYRRMMRLYPDKYSIVIWEQEDDEPPVFNCEKRSEEYISPEEAGDILHKSKGTIINYVKKGWLRGYKGFKWKVCKEDVENFKRPRKYRKGTDKNQRALAIERDGGKCRLCGSSERLEVHHIKHKAEGGTDDLDNLITLCAVCHAKQHEGEPIHNLMVSRLE